MATVTDGLARELPDAMKGRGVTLLPLHEAVIGGELRLTSILFVGVVGFVLLAMVGVFGVLGLPGLRADPATALREE